MSIFDVMESGEEYADASRITLQMPDGFHPTHMVIGAQGEANGSSIRRYHLIPRDAMPPEMLMAFDLMLQHVAGSTVGLHDESGPAQPMDGGTNPRAYQEEEDHGPQWEGERSTNV